MRKPGSLFALVLLAACSDAIPCSTCPAIAGTYSLTWSLPTGPTCAATAPIPPSLTITQQGSALSSSISDATLGGTLFDTYDLTLVGGPAELYYTLQARAAVTEVLQSARRDAGTPATPAKVHLEGSLTTFSADAGCQVREEFSADRQS